MARQLPPNANLTHLRNEAKRLLKLHRSGDPSCCEVIRNHPLLREHDDAAILAADLNLAMVQCALARDYGLESWKVLRDCIQADAPAREAHIAFWLAVVETGRSGAGIGQAFASAAVATKHDDLRNAATAVAGEFGKGRSMNEIVPPYESAFTSVPALLARVMDRSGDGWPEMVTRIPEAIAEGYAGPGSPPAWRAHSCLWQALGLLLSCGVPLGMAMTTLADKYLPDGELSSAFREVRDAIMAGSSMTEALSQHPGLFSVELRAAVLAGEKGGVLQQTCTAIGMSLKTGDMTHIKECYDSIGTADPETVLQEHLESAPVVRSVNMLLFNACKAGATQMELTAGDKEVFTLITVAGKRVEASMTVPLTMFEKTVARFKIMAALNWQETQTAQEGHFQAKLQGVDYEMHVRTETNGKHEKVTVDIVKTPSELA